MVGADKSNASACGCSRKGWEYSGLLAVILLALVLRSAGIDQQALSVDEVFDLNIASLPASEIFTAQDRFPPLYHLLLHGWVEYFGDPHTARWLSVALSVAAIPFLYASAKLIAGQASAFAAVFLLAISPLECYYSQEIRCYALSFLWAAVVFDSFFQSVYAGRRRWWLLVLATLGGVYTHYYFPLLPAALLLSTALHVPGPKVWRPLGVSVALVVVLSVPALFLLLHDLDYPWGHSSQSGFGLLELGYTFFSYVAGYGLGPSPRELHSITGGEALLKFAPWLAIVAILALPPAWIGLRRLRHSAYGSQLVLLTFTPVVVIGGLSLVGSFGYNIRHTLWALLPLCIWLGTGLAGLNYAARTLIACGLLLLSCLSISNRAYEPRYQNEDVRSAAAYLELAEQNNDVRTVFVCAYYMDPPLRHYLSSDWRVIQLADVSGDPASREATLSVVKDNIEAGKAFWLAYTREFHGDPESLLPELLGVEEEKPTASFAGVRLYRIAGK